VQIGISSTPITRGVLSAFDMTGRFVFERQAFLHREGLTFGSGSGFAVSYSDTLAAIAAAEAALAAAQDDYDFEEVLEYIWDDSDEGFLEGWNLFE
jgi:hypothetical protein